MFWYISEDEVAGHLVVVKKQDKVGHYHDHYYLQPVKHADMHINHAYMQLKGHDATGSVFYWTDAHNVEFSSVSIQHNSNVYFKDNKMLAGTLQSTNGLYSLKETSCRERGSCTEWCRCNDCPRTAKHMQTDEDFETEMKAIIDAANKAAEYARKGLGNAGKKLAAGGKVLAAAARKAREEGTKTVAALHAAGKAYYEHKNKDANGQDQSESESQNQNGQNANGQHTDSHLEQARQEEQKALAALETVNTANLSQEQKQRLAEAQEALRAASALVAQLVAQLAQNAG